MTAQSHLLQAREGKPCIHPISVLSQGLVSNQTAYEPRPEHRWTWGRGWSELMQSTASTQRPKKMNWGV